MGMDAEDLYRTGREAWPGISLARDVFARHISTAVEAGRPVAHAADLYLACAAAQGEPRACRELERLHMQSARASLRRMTGDDETCELLLQQVRDKLLVGPPPALTKYTGRTGLDGWIRLLAKRCAIDHFRQLQRRARNLAVLEAAPRSTPRNLDSHLDARRERERFTDAVQQALSSLSARDRTLLRLHYASGVSVDALGKAYGVHRATAARWVARLRGELFEAVRKKMRSERTLTDSDFAGLAGTLHNQIDLVLSSWQEPDR